MRFATRKTNSGIMNRRILDLRIKVWLNVLVICLMAAIPCTFGYFHQEYVHSIERMEGSLNLVAHAQEYVKPVEETPTQKQIADYIFDVFGKDDSRKAYLLLTCENSSYNPSAVNTAGNFPKGSRDIGVFQINEYWQKVQGKFLFNWKVNIEIAHQIYVDNGYSFHIWTCGRKLGI